MKTKLRSKVLIAASLAVLAFFSASSADAQSVSGSVPAVSRGGSARASVVLVIPAGLHVNSNRPRGEYMIATTVRASSKNVKVGSVSYPRGHDRKFSFSETALNVYEGRVVFTFPVSVPVSYKGSTAKINVSVRFQACSDEVCYAPKTKDLIIVAKVR